MAELRELASGVYAYLQPPLICYSTAGVIVGERDVIVVDSLANAVMAEHLLEEIRRVTDAPVRYLINTHSHFDHVYTNHLFSTATVIASHRGRQETMGNRLAQERHDALFARLFPEVDLRGGRYSVQDASFGGSLSLHQGRREVCVLELGVGHSESDVVVHLPEERIVFCGDVFLNGLPPLPLEGHVTQMIANLKAIEALGADVYVAGHGEPGTLDDVRAHRAQLEHQFAHARESVEKGMSYDAALHATTAEDGLPLDFRRLAVLASYCELTGQRPATADPASQTHMTVLQAVAVEAELLLGRHRAR
jgi:cyclase